MKKVGWQELQQQQDQANTSAAGTELWIWDNSQGKQFSEAGRRLQENSKEQNWRDMEIFYAVQYAYDRTCSHLPLLVWYPEPFLTFCNN